MTPEKETQQKAPIEEYFPVAQVNEIADREAKAKRYYRPVYTMHKWWARRLGSVFRTIILYSLADEDASLPFSNREFEMPDDPADLWDYYLEDVDLNDKVVLDPFMGGGTTIVEALRLGCKTIGCDLNPVAWFVVKKEVEPVDLDKLQEAYDHLKETIAPEIQSYYKTSCPKCTNSARSDSQGKLFSTSGDGVADVMYYFWVKELECLDCGKMVPLFKDYRIASARSKNDSFYHVLCPGCWEVIQVDDYRNETKCSHCTTTFTPGSDGNATGKYYTCPDCGYKHEVVEAVKRQGKPEEILYAIEYYCPSCNQKGYKSIEEEDRKLYQQASEEYQEKKDSLPIPDQNVKDGEKTSALLNHGYKKFKDMFNKRQLLNLGKLLKGIKEIQNENIQEFILLAFSKALDSNNMLCKYSSNNVLRNMFASHAFHPANEPVENNVWGGEYGSRLFKLYMENIIDGIKWKKEPEERFVENGNTFKKKMDQPVMFDVKHSSIRDVYDNQKNSYIFSQSSEFLHIDDKSVDAVITDPPYYSNVMYSELSDFFYVWLREVLKDRYDIFQGELTPKRTETIQSNKREKSKEDFIEGLTATFSESARKLKDDGVFVFTFHHKETDAWSSVLRSVLDAGLYINAIYPIRAEMSTSTHIINKANIEYDMIVVCRKRKEETTQKSWRGLQDDIYFRVEEEIQKLRDRDERLQEGDMYIIALGKCLELYSKHYPNVVANGEQVSVEKAVEDIRDIVDSQILENRFQELSDKYDSITATYLSFVVGRGDTIAYNSLNKDLRQRNLSVSDLTKSGLLRQKGDDLEVLEPTQRAADIRTKPEEKRTVLDRAHYLYHLYQQDKLTSEAKIWATEKTIDLMSKLSDEVANSGKAKDYGEIAEYVEKLIDWSE